MKNKKTIITITSMVAVLLVIIGVTYAYWLVTKTQTNDNLISTGCLDISLTGEKNDIELQDQFPLSDEDGMKLTPYEFTVTNNCTTSVDYQVNLESIGDSASAIKANAIKVALDDNVRLLSIGGTNEPTVSGAYESNTLVYGTLAGSSEETEEDTVTYELRIWIDEDAPISEQNKTYAGKISVTIGQGIFNPYKEGTLAYDILSNYGGANKITEVTDFNTVTAGLYKAQDDLGTSYYFRGNVENNLINFIKVREQTAGWIPDGIDDAVFETQEACEQEMSAAGIYTNCEYVEGGNIFLRWKIIRINGDGSIRLAYNGTSFDSSEGVITDVYYNPGVSADFNEASNVVIALDNWYDTNLKNYSQHIADGIFCNDKEETGEYEYYDDLGNPVLEKDAFNISATFAAKKRIKNKAPELTCTNKSDRYTTSDKLGNGLLSNPIGLITADEALMSSYNLYTLTMSPYSSDNIVTVGINIVYTYNGELNPVVEGNINLVPVINLKADVKFTGNGTTDSPYEIVMN